MFCPQCKAEYRHGFTKCSDCGVDLVENLDEDAAASTLQGDPEKREILWAGAGDDTRRRIEQALQAANINYDAASVESDLMPAFQTSIYRIRVRRGDYQAAVTAVQDVEVIQPAARRAPSEVLDDNSSFLRALGVNRDVVGRRLENARQDTLNVQDENDESAALDEPADDSPEPPESDTIENFYPEDATSEVWSGDDADMPENIKMCLSENGIGCAISSDGGKHRVMVLPADEARAKEIVREIVEESPPQ